MKLIQFIPVDTRIPFMRFRNAAMAVSLVLMVLSVGFFLIKGLNFGIDFRGGILVEIRTSQAADIGELRARLSGLNLGEIALQEFGLDTDVLIRIERQEGSSKDQLAAVEIVKQALGAGVEYRRVEFVGPKVSAELIQAGIEAVLLALFFMMVYIWFRFEWQFGVGAVIALSHDVITTIGLFAVTQLEFNLSTVAAVLTIAGYSINDTVVIYDRVREELRRYKKMPIDALLNLAANRTLSRTFLTSMTTLIALLALSSLGGPIIRDFSLAMIWGVLIGTYSSIFVAVPMLLILNLSRDTFSSGGDTESGKGGDTGESGA